MRRTFLILLAFTLVACGPDEEDNETTNNMTTNNSTTTTTMMDEDMGGGDDMGGDEDMGGSEDMGAEGLSFATDVQPIITASCSCHTPGPSGGLSLDDAFAAIVSVESSVAGVNYVEPGDPDNSYLLLKVEGKQGDVGGGGGQMPLAGGPLSDTDQATIRQWIADGANP